MVAIDVLRVIAVIAGLALVWATLRSAIQTFMLPRGVSDPIARFVFLSTRLGFDFRAARSESYEGRDRVMALYGPISLTLLTVVWIAMVMVGYMLMYWGIGAGTLAHCFLLSGSSTFTLGFVVPTGVGYATLVFSQAGIGLLLAALLVAYVPTIYGAWSRRERSVATLEVRAGSPPTAWELIIRYNRIRGLTAADELWPAWESWFIDIEESHTSLASISFFRSPQPNRSWVNAAGVILDSAAMFSSAVDVPRNPDRELCLRAGFIALRRIAALFRIPFDADPKPGDGISISQEEFNEVWRTMDEAGVPLKPDVEQAWKDFSGWRVNYDQVLLSLAALTMAPYAPWISDRSFNWNHPLVTYWRTRRGR